MSPLPQHQAALLASIWHGLQASVHRAGLQTGRDGRPGPVVTSLQAADRRIVVRIPVGTRDFSLSSKTYRSAVGHTQCVPGLLPRVDDDQSRLSCAEVKNEWSYTSPPLHAFMACAHIKFNAAFCLADRTRHVHSPG
jgi:hypothetical protein